MLGKLGKWLRFLGFDCVIARGEDDHSLLARIRAEHRVLLTRDSKFVHELIDPDDACWLVSSTQWQEQLKEVVHAFKLLPHVELFSRCSACNEVLMPVEREKVRDKVPPRSYTYGTHFSCCPGCGKIYWRGDHTKKMLATLESLFCLQRIKGNNGWERGGGQV